MGTMRNEDRTAAPLDPPREASSFGNVDRVSSQETDRALPPVAPAVPPAPLREREQRKRSLGVRETAERRSMLRGLLVFAFLVLLVSLLRAGTGRAFPAGLWR